MQSEDSLQAYVKTRIDPMIEKHECLRNSLGTRSKDDSLSFKKFKTMDVEFLSATMKNLINKSAPRIVADEIDAYAPSIGNVKPLLDVRRQTYGHESKLFLLSHPDLAFGLHPDTDWTQGIMSVYGDSNRCIWYWKCPHCGAYSSPCPLSDRYMYIEYPEDGSLDEIQDQAHLVCPINGCHIFEAQRLKMNQSGKWVGTGQTIDIHGNITGNMVKRDTAGFWIVGVMSPFILGGIGALARARVKSERELQQDGDEKTLRSVMTKQWGMPYVKPRRTGSVTANELAERAEHTLHLKSVPPGVRFLTAAWDVQLEHFDVLVRGWGAYGESWVIDRFRVGADTASNPDDWDKMIERLILLTYPLEGFAAKQMPLRGIGFDSAGAPGVTRQAYDAWMRWKDKKLAKLYGKINGREAWNIIPLKGANSSHASRLTVTWPDTSGRKDRQASKGTVPVAIFNPNTYKDDLAGQLLRAQAGPWAIHYPYDLRSQEEPHEWFEQLVSEQSDKAGKWSKIKAGIRNEALDLMVMTHVVAHLHGLSQIKWDNPPVWAAPWEGNSFLIPIEHIAFPDRKHNNLSENPEPGVKIIVAPEKKKNSFINKLA
jgi:phage terminase large subunit GpA-like protein